MRGNGLANTHITLTTILKTWLSAVWELRPSLGEFAGSEFSLDRNRLTTRKGEGILARDHRENFDNI